MSQAMSGGGGDGGPGQFGDTTFTKVFVGGLAWETHKEGMRAYFQQFGDILEAVVITDKNTGRSKGYGFVTFREPEAALRACIDPYPVIDGRRANCNLAYLGVNKSKTALVPQYLQQPYAHVYGGGSNIRATIKSFETAGAGGASLMSFVVPAADHGIQQGIPTYSSVYAAAGYSPYFSDYGYPLSYYQPYYTGLQQGGHQLQQYAVLGGGGAAAPPAPMTGLTMAAAANAPSGLYPYLQYGPASAAAAGGHGYSMVQYPQLYQYAAVGATAAAAATTLAAGVAGGLQQYGGAVPFTPNSIAHAGMTMSTLTSPTLAAQPAQQLQYSRLVVPSPLAGAAPDQKPSLA